jgi:hypothetical protein
MAARQRSRFGSSFGFVLSGFRARWIGFGCFARRISGHSFFHTQPRFPFPDTMKYRTDSLCAA